MLMSCVVICIAGCQIVYASFHKILITTDKSTFEEAKSHIDFVTQTIKQKPLFAYITLNPVEYHKILLFKDLYNYGSIKEKVKGGQEVGIPLAYQLP